MVVTTLAKYRRAIRRIKSVDIVIFFLLTFASTHTKLQLRSHITFIDLFWVSYFDNTQFYDASMFHITSYIVTYFSVKQTGSQNQYTSIESFILSDILYGYTALTTSNLYICRLMIVTNLRRRWYSLLHVHTQRIREYFLFIAESSLSG